MFNTYLQECVDKCPKNGWVTLVSGDEISEVIRNSVPNEPGVHLIYVGAQDHQNIVYIGYSGTRKRDGMSAQKLQRRLTVGKQDDMPFPKWLEQLMTQYSVQTLHIQWIVTWDENNRHVPISVKAKLLQAFLEEFGHLPSENRRA